MQIDLTSRTALVTGAAGGIGRACAEALAGAGARVLVVDINLPGAEQVAESIGNGALALRCDLGDPASVADLCARVEHEFGGTDIIVNNAGLITYRAGIGSVDLAAWDRMLDVNLRGPFLLCQGLVEGMKARRRGSIVNLSSMSARMGALESSIDYASSKGGLIAFTRTLAKECGPYGVRVNAVAPGLIVTGPVAAQLAGREEAYAATIPLRRLGTPEDVARVVLFYASDLSAYVTGTVLDINGGQYMG